MKKKVTIFTIGLVVFGFWFGAFEAVKAQSVLEEMLPKYSPTAGVKRIPQTVIDSKTAGAIYEQRELFNRNAALISDDNVLSNAVSNGVLLTLDKAAIRQIEQNSPQFLSLPLPDGKGGTIDLELMKVNIFAEGFKVETSAPTSDAHLAARLRQTPSCATRQTATSQLAHNHLLDGETQQAFVFSNREQKT